MAIYRVGPSAEEPHRTPLGRVIVTIDDLDALVALLRNQIGSPDTTDEAVKVEFDGGYFTKAHDLKRLSDEELRSIRVLSKDAQVILSASQAQAIGDKRVGENVYRLWARSRQIKYLLRRIVKPGWGRMAMLSALSGLLCGAFLAAAGFLLSMTNDGKMTFTAPTALVFMILGITVGVSTTFLGAYASAKFRRPPTFADVLPISLEEYRRTRSGNTLPRWTLVVTALSVAVAIAAIVVSVLVAK